MTDSTALNCMYCLDSRLVPDGIDDTFGEVFMPCPECVEPCWACDGESMFPAETRCLHCLAKKYLPLGKFPVLCPVCQGIFCYFPFEPRSEPADEQAH